MDRSPKIASVLVTAALLAWGSASAKAQVVEAESGTLLGSASVYADAVASGGRGIDYIDAPNAGFRLSNVPASSGVHIRYASRRSGSLSIWLDASPAGSVDFSSTGAWAGRYDSVFFPLEIPAGSDFAIVFANGDTAMNVDSVEFVAAAAESVEAESGTLLGSASVYADAAASGGSGMAYLSSPNAGFRLANVPASSGVNIRYASYLSGSLSIRVNGSLAGSVDFPSTGAWTGNYAFVFFPVDIPSGSDFEMVFMSGDTAMNVDLVEFVAPEPGQPGEEPAPIPEPDPFVVAWGIDDEGMLFHVDEGWSAAFNYLCVNGHCLPGERVDGVFQRDASAEVAVGQAVALQFKVEDDGGQCLTGDVTVTRQPGLTEVSSPCATAPVQVAEPVAVPAPEPVAVPPLEPVAPPAVEPVAVPLPEPVAAPAPLPSPEPAPGSPSDDAEPRGAGLVSVEGDTITTRLAERFRDRHESDRSHDRYIEAYAQGSAYEIVLVDRPDALEVQVHSPQVPLTAVNLRHSHIANPGFADPPQYNGGGFMAKGRPNGPADDDAHFQVNSLYFEMPSANGRPWAQVREGREIVTLEFTPRAERNGNFPQYYSDILRYRAGQGGVSFERDDARYFSAGPTTNFAHGSPGFEFSQAYLGIDQPSLHAFTLGRELFRASFLGDPLPGNGGNATGADPHAAASACSSCHFQLGKAAPPNRGNSEQQGFIHAGEDLRVAPALIGLGLLEAVDTRTIEALAARSGGRVPDGRFGWKATEPTLRDQVLKALDLDLGVRDVPEAFVDRLVAYIQGLGVPLRRHPAAQAAQQPNVGLRVPDAHAITDAEVLEGEAAFSASGCGGCHVPQVQTGDQHPVVQFRNITIRPFTDLLLWDMGSELCAAHGEGNADRCEWRTAPLWGIRLQEQVTGHATYLHDGRATSLDEAIRLHGGDAQASRDAYENLSETERNNLLLYLRSL